MFGFFVFFGVGGYLFCGVLVDDDGFFGVEVFGDVCGIYGGVVVVVNSYVVFNEWFFVGGDVV